MQPASPTLCAAGGIKLYFPETFTYKQVVIGDKINSDILAFAWVLQFYWQSPEAWGKVLVHCFAGQSRSATVIAAYLMLAKAQLTSCRGAHALEAEASSTQSRVLCSAAEVGQIHSKFVAQGKPQEQRSRCLEQQG